MFSAVMCRKKNGYPLVHLSRFYGIAYLSSSNWASARACPAPYDSHSAAYSAACVDS